MIGMGTVPLIFWHDSAEDALLAAKRACRRCSGCLERIEEPKAGFDVFKDGAVLERHLVRRPEPV